MGHIKLTSPTVKTLYAKNKFRDDLSGRQMLYLHDKTVFKILDAVLAASFTAFFFLQQ